MKKIIQDEYFDNVSGQISIDVPGRKTTHTHVMRLPDDTDIAVFERRKNEKLVMERGKTHAEDENIEALVELWESVIISVEGYEAGDLKEKVPVMQKIAAARFLGMRNILTEKQVEAVYGLQNVIKNQENPVIYLEVFAGRKKYLTTHIMKEPDLVTLQKYREIEGAEMTRKKGTMVISNTTLISRYREIYVAMLSEVMGYRGIGAENVPILHIKAVIRELFSQVDEFLQEIQGN